MSNDPRKPVFNGRVALAVALMAGAAACTASPRYPIDARDAPGGGGLVPWQPRYPVSAKDAAQDRRDAVDGSAVPAQDGAYPAPPPAAVAPPAQPAPSDDDTPRRLPSSGVDSSDLPPPPPSAMPHLMSETDAPSPPPGFILAVDQDSPDHAASFASLLEQVAYRHHRRHHKAKTAADAHDDDGSGASAQAPSLRGAAGADTPYQTSVRPGEKLADVAKRLNTTRDALIQLNDIKHPRHVHAGTVLKAPYRYNYQVQKGDTLYTIAHRFDQDPDAMAKLNGLKHAAALQPGQTVQLPPTAEDKGVRRHAAAHAVLEAAPERMIQAALQRAEAEDRRRARHGRHSQFAAVPRRHGQSVAAEVASDAAASSIASPRRGRAAAEPPATYNPPPIARAPAAAVATPPPAVATSSSASTALNAAAIAASRVPTPVPSSAPASAPMTSTYSATAAPGAVATLNAPNYRSTYPAGSSYAPSLGRARPTTPELSGGAMTAADIATAGRGRFVWPLHGSVLSGFGDHGTQHNDGVDIAVEPGAGVHAAAAGEVVYAGSSIPGFGNLVLVKHSGGWVTAYAHLNRIEVRMRDQVTQGEEIGQAGQTGEVDRPLLHFEVRYAPQPTDKARPVDPALVLPAG